ELENLLLAKRVLEPEGEDRLPDLSPDIVARILEQIFGDLLGDGRSARNSAAPAEVGRVIEHGLGEAGVIDAVVAEEVLVLGRYEGVHDERRDFVVGEVDAALA